MFTFISLRCSWISRLWTRKFQFEKSCCRDVEEVLSAIPVNTCRLMLLLHTSEGSNLLLLLESLQNYSSKILIDQSGEKAPFLWFQHSAAGFSKAVNEKEKEQHCKQGRDFNSESRARRSRGTGSTVRDLYVESRKDPLSTRAAHPALWGHAINKATVGPPVLLSLAICCLSWLLYCQVPALTLSSFTDWCYKGTLWLQHAGDCLPPVQFGNGTPEPLGLLVN